MTKKNKFLKNLIPLLLILLLSTCKAQNISQIKLSYVDLDIMTPIRVNCKDFESLFKSQIKTVLIRNKSDIDSILVAVNNLEVDTTNYKPDIRAKLEIFSSEKPKVYCLSNMGIYNEDISYVITDRILSIIKNYMK